MNQQNQIKRIAAIHDLCGYGKCSLGTALPILSAAGFEVVPIPTGLFSMQTEIPGYEQLDTTAFLPKYIGSLSQKNIKYHAIYSGFLCSEEQVSLIQKLYTENLDAIRILDPVMGEYGRLYSPQSRNICESFKELISGVDILTPNLTEASFLSDTEYVDNPDNKQIDILLNTLQEKGAQNIILKGAKIDGDTITNIVLNSDGNKTEIQSKYYDYQIHGSGDLFASVLTAAYLNDIPIEESTQFAANFLSQCVKLTTEQDGFEERGISFEPLMYNISGLINQI